MSGTDKVVCVTGGSGYIASWLIKLLLHRGYSVKATIRNPSDPKRTEHLLELDGAKERLRLFKASLLDEGSFDSAIDGCEAVFHTASPVTYKVSDPVAELVEPAVKGTINVLKSCVKAKSVKRVILTASTASVFLDTNHPDPTVEVDETWFSDPKFCEEKKLWYPLGKTLAEKAAWDFAKQNKIDLVTVHPGYVLGPMLQPTVNFSIQLLLNVLKGEAYPNAYFGAVDVRDVGNAHIKAFENPSATGRYLLVSDTKHFSEVIKIVKEQFPDIQVPRKCADINGPHFPYEKVSKERAMSLGVNFMPLEESLRDTILYLAQKELISI